MRSFQLLLFLCFILGCESSEKRLEESDHNPKLINLPKDPFVSKYLFDDSQGLLRLDIENLSHYQIDTLLKFLLRSDQKYRIQINEIRKSGGNNQLMLIDLGHKMKKTDSLNFILLKRIFKKIGWPGNKIYSDSAVNASFFITLHHGGNDLEYLSPLLEKSFTKNEIKNDHYAVLVDRILIRKGLSQKFGTHCRKNRDESIAFISLPDSSFVNENRRQIGLSSLNWTTCDLVIY